MATNTNYVQLQKTTVLVPITSSTTSIQLSSLTLIPDNTNATANVTMAMFGTTGYGTLEPGTSKEENISFTGITQNSDGTATLTGVTRGLQFVAPFTSASNYQFAHAGGSVFIITDNTPFISTFANKTNDEVITGLWTVPDPVGSTGIANKEYVLSVVNGGAVSFSTVAIAGTAGETVTAGKVVYLKVSDGRWYLAKDSDQTTLYGVQLGIAQGSGSAGVAIASGVAIEGLDTNQSGIVAGTAYYVGAAGALTTSAGTNARKVAQGTQTNTQVYFNPNYSGASTTQANGIIQANSVGKIDQTFGYVGGTGADGALSIASGTTTINCANAAVVVKNYTSISITGTGTLAFSNPNASGTFVILKSQGAVTLTSSSAPMIDMSKMGAQGVVGTNSADGAAGSTYAGAPATAGGNHTGTAGVSQFLPLNQAMKIIPFVCGSAGGTSASSGNNSGSGGGALYIECGGAWNFTTASGISVGGGSPPAGASGASCGGGGAGRCFVLYRTLTANSGTVTTTGGGPNGTNSSTAAGGGAGASASGTAGSGNTGGTGGAGDSFIAAFTEI